MTLLRRTRRKLSRRMALDEVGVEDMVVVEEKTNLRVTKRCHLW